MNDWELIQNYCRNGSESAFETLVKRHVDYVYCAALRQVRDPSLAEDVSQAVFLLLARKAKTFRSGTILVSWLFRTTHYISGRALRSEFRRQRRELEAAKMNPMTTTPETDHQWERVSPILDEALAALPNKDRDAVLLRFISQKPFSQVGAEIGVSEDAAKKRVTRALARLREFFARRGTTLSVAATAVLLGERVVQASPAALATKIAGAAGAGASAATTTATALLKATLRDLLWTRLKWGAAIGTGLVAALWLGTMTVRPARNPTTTSTPPAPLAQVQSSTSSDRVVEDASDANQNTTNHVLRLLVERMEDQQPIARARVLVDYWVEKHRLRALDANTDSNGLLNIPIPGKAFSQLALWVSAEDRVPMLSDWQAYEFNEPVVSHTMMLEAGQTASGTVLDEWGKPVWGATISLQPSESGGSQTKRDRRAFHPEMSAIYTDAFGRWTTTQFPPEAPGMGVSIRVTSPDYTPASEGLSGFPTNVVIVLSNGVALSGQITATDGKPIANAEVAKQSGIHLSIRTDADGRFSWPHVEPGKVSLEVQAGGYEKVEDFIWATNAANECAFTLEPSSNPVPAFASSEVPQVQLHGTVVDADTGLPIPAFAVLIGDRFMSQHWGSDAALPEARFLGEGHDGQFNWLVPHGGGFRLQIEAEGYLELVSEERSIDDADKEFAFKLRRPTILAGSVVTPDGSPAENAEVTFTGPNMGAVMQKPGQLFEENRRYEDARTRTDNEGKFRLKFKLGARGIAIVHPSGTALVTFAAATNDTIVLQPWGAIEGTLYLNGQPASNQTLEAGGSQKSEADPRITFSFGYQTTTDEHGHFRFDQVLPGEDTVTRWVGVGDSGPSEVKPDQTAQVKVESGAVATVELRRQGRPVIGRLVFQGNSNDLYWGTSTAVLQGSQGAFPFALSKDGTMRADDVPPGNYTLSIKLVRSADLSEMYEKIFGTRQEDVVVPAAEDETVPVDLGELTVERAK